MAGAVVRSAHAVHAVPSSRAFSTPEPLDDDVVLSQRIPLADLQKLYSHSDRICIGFEHENKNPRRTHAHINR